MKKIIVILIINNILNYNLLFSQGDVLFNVKNNQFDRGFITKDNKIFCVKYITPSTYKTGVYDSSYKLLRYTNELNIENSKYINDTTVLHGYYVDNKMRIYRYNTLTNTNTLFSIQENVNTFIPVNERVGYMIIKKDVSLNSYEHNTYLLKTENGYKNFYQVSSWNEHKDIDFYLHSFVSENIAICLGRKKILNSSKEITKYYITSNGGISYKEINNVGAVKLKNPDFISVYMDKNDNIVLLNNEKVFISNDNGKTFTESSKHYSNYFKEIKIGY